ncbi:MAG: protein translocase subunit SecF [Nanoarchaeota archaeon]|nr:protein translocase subunit SecF [Nanoarchaeota archaeon]
MTSMLDSVKKFYEQQYKYLLLFPFLLLVGSFLQIGWQYAETGDFVNKGITLKGGSTITVNDDGSIDSIALQRFLQENFPDTEILVRTITTAGSVVSLAIDTDLQESSDIDNLLSVLGQKVILTKENYSVEIIGSSLGKSFFKQTAIALLIAFVLMAAVVFLYFRTLIPSLTVILAAFSDIVVTIAIFNLTGMKLSTAGVAAFLMLIGYSVDTDILLGSRFFKRQDLPVMERIYSAIKTGLTMTTTAIAAVVVTLIFVSNDVVKQIMVILLIGLFVDIIMTWIQNVGTLRLYHEKTLKGGKVTDETRF